MKYGFKLTCKEASQLISQSLDQPLSLTSHLKLRFHLLICDACTRFRQQLQHIRHSLRQMRHKVENDNSIVLSHEAKARISKTLPPLNR